MESRPLLFPFITPPWGFVSCCFATEDEEDETQDRRRVEGENRPGAVRGQATTADLAQRYQVHLNQIYAILRLIEEPGEISQSQEARKAPHSVTPGTPARASIVMCTLCGLSKQALVIEMLSKDRGATLDALSSHLFGAKDNGPPHLPFEIVPVAIGN